MQAVERDSNGCPVLRLTLPALLIFSELLETRPYSQTDFEDPGSETVLLSPPILQSVFNINTNAIRIIHRIFQIVLFLLREFGACAHQVLAFRTHLE